MKQKPFGRTVVSVSEIGMGTYYDPLWTAMSFLGWRRDAEKKVRAIRTGIEEGITLIDTAEIYGSEPLVARAIRGVERGRLFVATKVWPNHLKRDSLRRALDGSLKRLGLSYVDLYQIHWPNKRVPISETMGVMEELAKEGKIKHVGVSNFSLPEIEKAVEALTSVRLVSIQMSYSLVDRSIEKDILPYCNEHGIAVLAYYPLGHGKLTHRIGELEKFCKKYSKTQAQIALRWLASKSNVFPIPRASKPEHVKENAGASGWEMDVSDLAELDALFSD